MPKKIAERIQKAIQFLRHDLWRIGSSRKLAPPRMGHRILARTPTRF